MGSAFSGVGAWEKALTNLGIEHELQWYVEFDRWASTSYSAIHNVSEDLNKGDITEVNPKELDDIDLFVYSPPCQSFSVAGKQKGDKDPRGRLFYNALPIIQEKQPKYALMENVKGLTQKRFEGLFEDMLNELELAGYNNYHQVLNAKDYGIPQNRERVFIISIRKDVDDGNFEFPEPFDSGLRLKDVLLDSVENKYYVNNERTEVLLENLTRDNSTKKMVVGNINPSGNGMNGNVYSSDNVSPTITTNKGEGIKVICAERGRYNKDGKIEQRLEIQQSGNSNALTTVQKDNLVLEPSILRYERTEYGKQIRKQYESGGVKEKMGNMRELRPRPDGISNTLTTVQKDNLVLEPSITVHDSIKPSVAKNFEREKEEILHSDKEIYQCKCDSGWQDNKVGLKISPALRAGNSHTSALDNLYRIRKLTPLECWRLMAFSDEDFNKARERLIEVHYNGNDRANTQLYKQAGNSVCVNVLEEVYKKLFLNR